MLKNTGRVNQRFSIRKLTIGAASVLLGTFLFWGGSTVSAAETSSSNSSEITQRSNEESNLDKDTDVKTEKNISGKNSEQVI